MEPKVLHRSCYDNENHTRTRTTKYIHELWTNTNFEKKHFKPPLKRKPPLKSRLRNDRPVKPRKEEPPLKHKRKKLPFPPAFEFPAADCFLSVERRFICGRCGHVTGDEEVANPTSFYVHCLLAAGFVACLGYYVVEFYFFEVHCWCDVLLTHISSYFIRPRLSSAIKVEVVAWRMTIYFPDWNLFFCHWRKTKKTMASLTGVNTEYVFSV